MFTFFYVVCVRPTFDIIFLNIILHPFISIHASQISHQFRAFYRNGSNGWKPRFRSRTSGIGEVRSTSMLQMMSSSFTQSATRQHQRRCARRILHRNCCVLRYFSARDGVHHPSCVFFLIIVPMVEYIAPATFYVITLRPCSQWATYLHLSANTYRLWQVSTQHQHQLVTLRLSLQYKLHLDLSLSTSCLETRYQHLLLSTSRLRRLSLSKQHWWHWWGAMPWWDWGFMLCVRVSQKRIWRRVWHSRSSRWDDSKSERTWRAFFGTFVLWVGGSTRWSGRVFMWHVWGWRRHFGMLPGPDWSLCSADCEQRDVFHGRCLVALGHSGGARWQICPWWPTTAYCEKFATVIGFTEDVVGIDEKYFLPMTRGGGGQLLWWPSGDGDGPARGLAFGPRGRRGCKGSYGRPGDALWLVFASGSQRQGKTNKFQGDAIHLEGRGERIEKVLEQGAGQVVSKSASSGTRDMIGLRTPCLSFIRNSCCCRVRSPCKLCDFWRWLWIVKRLHQCGKILTCRQIRCVLSITRFSFLPWRPQIVMRRVIKDVIFRVGSVSKRIWSFFVAFVKETCRAIGMGHRFRCSGVPESWLAHRYDCW